MIAHIELAYYILACIVGIVPFGRTENVIVVASEEMYVVEDLSKYIDGEYLDRHTVALLDQDMVASKVYVLDIVSCEIEVTLHTDPRTLSPFAF